jgi:hypothetical protein
MKIIHDRHSILSLPIITGLLGVGNVGAVNADTPNDACALLTVSQVSSALGASVGPGQPVMPNNATTCTWVEQGVAAGTERNVTVSLMTAKSFENGKTPMPGITKTPVSGIADDAYFIEPHGMTVGLSVRKGDACFQVRARSNPKWFRTGKTPESEQKDQGADRALALEILKKL